MVSGNYWEGYLSGVRRRGVSIGRSWLGPRVSANRICVNKDLCPQCCLLDGVVEDEDWASSHNWSGVEV